MIYSGLALYGMKMNGTGISLVSFDTDDYYEERTTHHDFLNYVSKRIPENITVTDVKIHWNKNN